MYVKSYIFKKFFLLKYSKSKIIRKKESGLMWNEILFTSDEKIKSLPGLGSEVVPVLPALVGPEYTE